MDYMSFVEQLNIKQGDKIMLSSELIKLVLLYKKSGIKFDGSILLDTFQEAVGVDGTILIPTFSFDFSNKGIYDVVNTKGTTGVLGNIALQRGDFVRTQHPMHSFAVWGKDKDTLVGMTNRNSFGTDSPFGYCISSHVRQIILGTDYRHGMTFIHYAEVVCNVPYRFSKSFTGKYIDAKGQVEERIYDYAARKLEIEPKEVFNKMGSILEKKGVSKVILIDGIKCYDIDLASSFPIICEDIINNQCRNIYDFNIERERIFHK
jgi:aminoglycoside 3-N-acetyltransferase